MHGDCFPFHKLICKMNLDVTKTTDCSRLIFSLLGNRSSSMFVSRSSVPSFWWERWGQTLSLRVMRSAGGFCHAVAPHRLLLSYHRLQRSETAIVGLHLPVPLIEPRYYGLPALDRQQLPFITLSSRTTLCAHMGLILISIYMHIRA